LARSNRSGATFTWGASRARDGGCSTSRHAFGIGAADERAYGLHLGRVHPDNVVTTMSGGEKQGVAISRALYSTGNWSSSTTDRGLSLTVTKRSWLRVRHQEGRAIRHLHRHNIFHVYTVVDRLMCSTAEKLRVFTKSQIRWTS